MSITAAALKEMGFKDPDATFTQIALAGGFGSIAPNHAGGLDVDGITDPAAKRAVADILASVKEKKESPKV